MNAPDVRYVLRRDLAALADRQFDLLVIGGGILGACVAWDAALRGLSTALVEKDDFGGGTSSNSLKIIHGGLRYLQHLDFRRVRESIQERSAWLRIAPHLVEPLPVLIPAYGHMVQGRLLLRLALAINDLLSADLNSGLPPGREIPPGRALSRQECVRLVPELETPELTGAVLFHDAQTYSSERLVLEVVQAAAAAGVSVANYAELEPPLVRHTGMVTAQVRDKLSDNRVSVQARVIVNAAGPAAPLLASRLTGQPRPTGSGQALAMNLIFPGHGHSVAFAIPGASEDRHAIVKRGPRRLFIVPWRGHSLVGTAYFPCPGDAIEPSAGSREVEAFLHELSTGLPGARLRAEDVTLVHKGLLPAHEARADAGLRLLRHHRVIDHAAHGLPAVLTAISVKFTTGRLLAEEVVNRVFVKLGRKPPPCRTHLTPLPGGAIESPEALQRDAERRHGTLLPRESLEHLVRTYGARYEEILAYRHTLQGWAERPSPAAPVIRAQFVHGALHEMAQRPEDLIRRRTELGARGFGSEGATALAMEALKAASERDVL